MHGLRCEHLVIEQIQVLSCKVSVIGLLFRSLNYTIMNVHMSIYMYSAQYGFPNIVFQ